MADDATNVSPDDASLEQQAPAYPAPSPIPGAGRQAPQPGFAADSRPIFSSAGEPPPPPPGKIHDYGLMAWNATVGMGSSVLGLASALDRGLGGSPESVRYIEQQRQNLQDYIESNVRSMSPERQQALRTSLFQGGETDPTTGERIPSVHDPGFSLSAYIASTLAGNAPMAALAFVPGGLLTRAALAVGFGAQSGGDAYEGLVKQVDNASDKQMMDSPLYAQLRHSGSTIEEAKSAIVAHLAPTYVAANFGLGAFTGGVGVGGVIGKDFLSATAGMIRRAAVGGAEAGATMGIQAGGQSALDQSTAIQLGLQKEFDPSKMALDFASGVIGGFAFGAPLGAIRKPPSGVMDVPSPKTTPTASPTRTPGVDATIADDAQKQALTATYGPEPSQGFQYNLPLEARTAPPETQGNLFPELTPAPTTPPSPPAGGPTAGSGGGAPPPGAGPASGGGGALPATTITPPVVAAGGAPATVSPSGLSRSALVDWAVTSTGMPQQQANRMATSDLDLIYMLHTRGSTPTTPTAPEPERDIKAQIRDMQNPNTPRDSVYQPAGNLPKTKGAALVKRADGSSLLTTNAQKAKLFRTAPAITQEIMAHILGHTSVKPPEGRPSVVVQGKDQHGNVVHEEATSPENLPNAQANAQARVPDGTVTVVTPQQAIDRRMQASANEPIDKNTPVEKAAAQAKPPSPAQAEAGNYQKGHINLHGIDVTIETARGDVRQGPIDAATGKPEWESVAPGHYGYIRGTKGGDGDQVDVTLSSHVSTMLEGTPAEANNRPVFVVDQIDPATGKFDEHKAFIGYGSPEAAAAAYDAQFSDGSGPSRRGAVNTMSFAGFKEWLKAGNTSKAISYRPEPKPIETRAEPFPTVGKPEEVAPKPTVSERLKRKQQLAEQQATPGPRMKGETAGVAAPTAEASTPVVPRPVEAPKAAELKAKAAEAQKSQAIQETRAEEQAREGGTSRTVEPGEGTSEGQVLDLVGGGKGERAKGSALVRRLSDIEHEFTQGNITAEEADAQYGTQPPGPGRPRAIESFGDWLESRLKVATDPTNLNKLLINAEKMLKAAQGTAKKVADMRALAKKYIAGGKPGEVLRARKLNEDADKLEEESVGRQDTLTEQSNRLLELTDPKYVAKLKEGIEALKARDRKARVAKYEGEQKPVEAPKPVEKPVEKPAPPKLPEKKTEPKPKSAPEPVKSRWDVGKTGVDELAHVPKHTPMTALRTVLDYVRNRGAKSGKEHMVVIDQATGQAVHASSDGKDDVVSIPSTDLEKLPANSVVLVHNHPGADAVHTGPSTSDVSAAIPDSIAHSLIITDDGSTHTYNITQAFRDKVAARMATQRMSHVSAIRILVRKNMVLAERNPVKNTIDSMLRSLINNNLIDEKTANRYFQDLINRRLDFKGIIHYESSNELPTTIKRAFGDQLRFGGASADEIDRLTKSVRPDEQIARISAEMAARAGSAERSDTEAGIEGGAAGVGATDEGGALGRERDELTPTDRKKLSDWWEKSMDTVDARGMGATARRSLMQWMTGDGLHTTWRKLFQDGAKNYFDNFQEHDGRTRYEAKKFRDANQEEAKQLATKLGRAENQAVSELGLDATMAKTAIGTGVDPARNAHLTTPEERTALADLQARYNKLTPAQQQLYTQARKFGSKRRAKESKSSIRGTLRALGLDERHVTALADIANDRAKVDDYLARNNVGHGDVAKEIITANTAGRVQGDYWPLRRPGNWLVQYGDKGTPTYGLEAFESRTAAEARRDELVKQGGPTNVTQVFRSDDRQAASRLSDKHVNDVLKAMEGKPDLADKIEPMQEILAAVRMQYALRSERARDMQRRTYVKGASADMARALSGDFLGAANRIGYFEHGPARAQALYDMGAHARSLRTQGGRGDNVAAQDVVRELRLRTPIDGDDSSKFTGFGMRKWRGMAYLYSLMSPSHMLINTIDSLSNSIARMSARHPAAVFTILNSMRKVAPTMIGLGTSRSFANIRRELTASDWNILHLAFARLKQGETGE